MLPSLRQRHPGKHAACADKAHPRSNGRFGRLQERAPIACNPTKKHAQGHSRSPATCSTSQASQQHAGSKVSLHSDASRTPRLQLSGRQVRVFWDADNVRFFPPLTPASVAAQLVRLQCWIEEACGASSRPLVTDMQPVVILPDTTGSSRTITTSGGSGSTGSSRDGSDNAGTCNTISSKSNSSITFGQGSDASLVSFDVSSSMPSSTSHSTATSSSQGTTTNNNSNSSSHTLVHITLYGNAQTLAGLTRAGLLPMLTAAGVHVQTVAHGRDRADVAMVSDAYEWGLQMKQLGAAIVVSKDQGFCPLLRYLGSQRVMAVVMAPFQPAKLSHRHRVLRASSTCSKEVKAPGQQQQQSGGQSRGQSRVQARKQPSKVQVEGKLSVCGHGAHITRGEMEGAEEAGRGVPAAGVDQEKQRPGVVQVGDLELRAADSSGSAADLALLECQELCRAAHAGVLWKPVLLPLSACERERLNLVLQRLEAKQASSSLSSTEGPRTDSDILSVSPEELALGSKATAQSIKALRGMLLNDRSALAAPAAAFGVQSHGKLGALQEVQAAALSMDGSRGESTNQGHSERQIAGTAASLVGEQLGTSQVKARQGEGPPLVLVPGSAAAVWLRPLTEA